MLCTEETLVTPLSDTHVSFCSDFEIISGIPVYIFNAHQNLAIKQDMERLPSPPSALPDQNKGQLQPGVLLALLSNAMSGKITKGRKLHNFRTAVAAATFAATMTKAAAERPHTTRCRA